MSPAATATATANAIFHAAMMIPAILIAPMESSAGNAGSTHGETP